MWLKIVLLGQIHIEESKVNADKSQWVFKLANGERVKSWAYLSYTANGQTREDWYYFDDNNIMKSGWINVSGIWYYLLETHNGSYGAMAKGWYQENGKWYYLDQNSGAMQVGWTLVNGVYYYLNPTANIQNRPYGSMYQSEQTPDNYRVNENGAWIQ